MDVLNKIYQVSIFSLKSSLNKTFHKLLLVPIITLLFEGGEDSIRSIYNDLRKNIPVIIVNVNCWN